MFLATSSQKRASDLDSHNGNRLWKRKRTFHFGTWNVQSFANKKSQVQKEVERAGLDLVVLTETKLKGKGQELSGEYVHIWSGVGRDMRARAGVSVLIKKRHKDKITHCEEISERFIRVDLNVFGRGVTVIGVYGPGNSEPTRVKEEFEEDFRLVLEKIRGSDEIIILGDFNARVGRQVGSRVIGRCGEEQVTDNGKRLIDICETFDLQIQNTFFQHKPIHQFTWSKPGFQPSILDYCITKQTSSCKVEDVRVFRGWECGTDHFMLRTKILFPWKGGRGLKTGHCKSESITLPKYKLYLLAENSVGRLYRNRLEEKIDLSHGNNLSEKYEHLRECIHSAAREALGYEEDRKQPDWWTEEVENLVKAKKEAYKKYLASSRNQDWITYRALNKQVKDEVAKEKNNSWERCCRKIDGTLGFNRAREAWNVLRSMRAPRKGNILSTISEEAWKKHYETLLSENRAQFVVQKENTQEKTKPEYMEVTEEEVRTALSRAKGGTAPGPGGLHMELIKAGGDKMLTLLTNVVNMVLRGGDLPEDIRTGYICSIFKKGDRKQCRNYRGICVQSSVSRIIGRLVRDKLEEQYITPMEQTGFTAGRSCMDNIFVLRQLIEKHSAKNKELHLAFIDLEQAYDSIPRERIWPALRKAGITESVVRTIQYLYGSDLYRVKIGNRLTEPFSGSKGLKQGCCLSPSIFKIYLAEVVKRWMRRSREYGVYFDDDELLTLFFADDQVVMARKKVFLEMVVVQLKEIYEKAGLKINFQKTEYMAIGDEKENLRIGDQVCTKVNSFKYLGSYLDDVGTSEVDVRNKVEMSRKVVYLHGYCRVNINIQI